MRYFFGVLASAIVFIVFTTLFGLSRMVVDAIQPNIINDVNKTVYVLVGLTPILFAILGIWLTRITWKKTTSAKVPSGHKSDPEKISSNANQSLAKAVYNHSKDIASEVKPAINDYKQRHQGSVNDTVSVALDEHHTMTAPGSLEQRRLIGGYNSEQHDYIVCKACKALNVKENNICYKCKNTLFELPSEDSLYEQALVEVEENKQIKSLWGKALAQSGGDENRAKALYIQMRVEAIEQERLRTGPLFQT